jgi:hypothetical protein
LREASVEPLRTRVDHVALVDDDAYVLPLPYCFEPFVDLLFFAWQHFEDVNARRVGEVVVVDEFCPGDAVDVLVVFVVEQYPGPLVEVGVAEMPERRDGLPAASATDNGGLARRAW